MQRDVEREQRDQRGDIAGRELRGRMAVRQRRGLRAELERSACDAFDAHAFVQARAEEPDRRDAHRAAATLARVARPLAERRAFAQGVDDADARHARREQRLVPQQPAVQVRRDRGRLALRVEPAQVGVADDRGDVGAAVHRAARIRAQQPLRGEQRELRVVGDRAVAPERLEVAVHAARPERRADLLERHELDRRAERVADRAAHEASAPTAAPRRRRLGPIARA